MISFHAHQTLALVALLAWALAPCPAGAGAQEGEALYESHCLGCHGPEVYTREDRKIRSFEGLERQVQRCELSLGLQWFDEDIGDVASYLNERFYHFAR